MSQSSDKKTALKAETRTARLGCPSPDGSNCQCFEVLFDYGEHHKYGSVEYKYAAPIAQAFAFSGSKAFGTLPLTLRRDVRHFFGSFGAVRSEARRFLFSLGLDGIVEEACQVAVDDGIVSGSKDGLFHLDGRRTEELPAVLRTFVGCASVLVGDAEDANLVTIDISKRSVAFYYSPDFGAPLVMFVRSSTVYLRDQKVRERVLSDDKRLLFLCGSEYEADPVKRRKRSLLEEKMRLILGDRGRKLLTARYGDVSSGLKNS